MKNRRKDEFKRKPEIDFDGFVGSDGIAHEPAECLIRSDVPNGWELLDREMKLSYVRDVYAFWITRLWHKRMGEFIAEMKVDSTISNWNSFIKSGANRLDDVWNSIVDAMNVLIGLEKDIEREKQKGAEETNE